MHEPETTSGRFRKWYVAGIDVYGSRHIVNFEDQIMYVVTAAGQLEHVQHYDERCPDTDHWMEHVEDKRGFLDRRYGGSLLDGLTDDLEGCA